MKIKGPFFVQGRALFQSWILAKDQLSSGKIFNRNLMGFYVNLRYAPKIDFDEKKKIPFSHLLIH